LDIPLYYRGKEGLAEAIKELELTNMVDMHPYQVLNLATVRLLQRPKAANIKWLVLVGGVYRHVERNNIVLPVVELEFGRVVALVAVEDQQPVFALVPGCRIIIEVLDPI
jgi:hypothetical protein